MVRLLILRGPTIHNHLIAICASPRAARRREPALAQEWRYDKLWFAVPPSREVYCIDPKMRVVHSNFPRKHLWVTDSNLSAFYDSGYGEKIQLADGGPLPHGMTILEGNAPGTVTTWALSAP
jgi:hypothetical protein